MARHREAPLPARHRARPHFRPSAYSALRDLHQYEGTNRGGRVHGEGVGGARADDRPRAHAHRRELPQHRHRRPVQGPDAHRAWCAAAQRSERDSNLGNLYMQIGHRDKALEAALRPTLEASIISASNLTISLLANAGSTRPRRSCARRSTSGTTRSCSTLDAYQIAYRAATTRR